MLEKFTEVMEKLVGTMQKREREVRRPELDLVYSGVDYENPRQFIQKIQETCYRDRLEKSVWTKFAASRLRGDALRWYMAYQWFGWTFEEFTRNLIAKFDNDYVRLRLQKDLFCKTQGQEEVALFIERKLALCRRLEIRIPNPMLASQIRLLMRPELQRAIVGVQIREIQELSRVATEVEMQVKYLGGNAGGEGTPTSRELVPVSQRPRGPETGCRICSGGHWNRDCPRRVLPGPSGGEMRRPVPELPEGDGIEGNPRRGDNRQNEEI